ncbi:phytoene/squalene synthase family protein [Methylocystis sp. SB2]|uniref:phytoene/squalene synthase family protein n=3 Tax=Methylocystis sp. (strain SB2) TaxID=743836 RepID=UPI001EFBB98C|nr:phytoene/squalene synthase family protein [Methylocystis sp. SB2]ULO25334.1 phytoene/squalene synthase family protein [Methylocystis sp. SB2]
MHPFSPDVAFAARDDHAACREAIRQGSRSFFAASLILPSRVRAPAYGLYAFCRLSDDAVDVEGGSFSALERLRERLAGAYEGRPNPVAADRAMADLVRRYAIPRAVPEALLEGLAWDAEGRRYETLDELFDYAARVAGTVGVMMTLLMGVREPQTLARACDLGIAMQLTNIARDVGEDARAGRLYLPRCWLREAGVDPEGLLARPGATPALKSVVARLLREADVLYTRARRGIAQLPLPCRPAILAAALLYAEIGRELEGRYALDSITQRARVGGARKLALVARAGFASPWLSGGAPLPPLDAAMFLIEAIARHPGRPLREADDGALPQFLRVLEIFERLERAERYGD